MSRARWSLVTLFVVSAVARAAEGTHPGPLPPPHDAAGGAPTSPDYAYPGLPAEGFGTSHAPGSAPGYGAAADYPPDWGRAQAPGSYGYPAAMPGYGQRGYGYEGYPGAGSAPGRDRPRGYWIWVPAEAVESTIGGYGAPQPSYGGYDTGYPAYPAYPQDTASGAYPTMIPDYAGQGGGANPPFGSGPSGPAEAEGWWGPETGGGRGEPFGGSGTPLGSRGRGPVPPQPESKGGAAARPAPSTPSPTTEARGPAAAGAAQPPAAKDGAAALFRPTPPPEPAPAGN